MSVHEVVHRPAQTYAAIPIVTTMAELGATAPPLHGEVFDWLAEHGLAASGPPFWRYDVINMPSTLQLQVGVTTGRPVRGDDRVVAGELPAGKYLQRVHRGHPDTLEGATTQLLAYADTAGLEFDVVDGPEGQRWAARLEFYLTDPAEQPDLDAWETLLAFKLVG